MPNIVRNIITSTKPLILCDIANKITDDSGNLDFERVIPCPAHVTEERRDWNTRCWGTKWNAMNSRIDAHSIEFETAWEPPHPVIEELARRWPDVGLQHFYSNEDSGAIGVLCCRFYIGSQYVFLEMDNMLRWDVHMFIQVISRGINNARLRA